jgi:hypothetical protein
MLWQSDSTIECFWSCLRVFDGPTWQLTCWFINALVNIPNFLCFYTSQENLGRNWLTKDAQNVTIKLEGDAFSMWLSPETESVVADIHFWLLNVIVETIQFKGYPTKPLYSLILCWWWKLHLFCSMQFVCWKEDELNGADKWLCLCASFIIMISHFLGLLSAQVCYDSVSISWDI